jgi:uncharacterized protein
MAQSRKTFAVIFESGDQVVAGLRAFAEKQNLAASHFTAIGAFKGALLGYFDWKRKDYTKIPISDQVEVLSLVGDITVSEGAPNIHAHVVLGKPDGTTCGGHLIEAQVRPTLEVILTESPAHLSTSARQRIRTGPDMLRRKPASVTNYFAYLSETLATTKPSARTESCWSHRQVRQVARIQSQPGQGAKLNCSLRSLLSEEIALFHDPALDQVYREPFRESLRRPDIFSRIASQPDRRPLVPSSWLRFGGQYQQSLPPPSE